MSWDARLVLKGLESYVDDNGVGKDDLALIVSDVFPHDIAVSPHDTLMRVDAALSALHAAGLIWRYETDSRKYLYISSWESVQRINRPSAGRFPRPDGTLHFKDSVIRECAVSPHDNAVSPRCWNRGTGEQGNRGSLSDPADSYERARDDSAERETTPAIDLDPSGAVVPAGHAEYPMILIPDDWQPDDLTRAKHPRPDIEAQADAFRDHARAVGRRCHGPAGWNAAFSSWLRKNPPPGQGAATTKARGWVDLVADLAPTDPDTHPDQKAIR
ncbi:hypothetical protein MYK68_16040 [Gordonia sp. PP30]|uniref:hypothetical protein n=1 Tax=Gordonia sp. PP30 TaxID=2935861 RepID=UPI001FFF8747|nr:hypothetical protein [Gordonia sp. PP30]UQE74222.1 hypothetical protein MYK68_16040 [Gordonia sp. PP30]